jgi:hypothetical protein
MLVVLLVDTVKHNRVDAILIQAFANGLVAKGLSAFPAHDTVAFVTDRAHLLHSLLFVDILFFCVFI